eukprot:8570472-Prorocentrum_lima.AAC.1
MVLSPRCPTDNARNCEFTHLILNQVEPTHQNPISFGGVKSWSKFFQTVFSLPWLIGLDVLVVRGLGWFHF